VSVVGTAKLTGQGPDKIRQASCSNLFVIIDVVFHNEINEGVNPIKPVVGYSGASGQDFQIWQLRNRADKKNLARNNMLN